MKVPIAELQQDPKNARTHDRANIEAIKASLARFGQVLPIVVREGQIVGGNGTALAAEELGWTELECILYKGSRAEAQALALALNRTSELASWDKHQLTDILVGLADEGFLPDELGFTDRDLDRLFPPDKILPVVEQDPVFADAAPKVTPARAPSQYALLFDDEGQEARFYSWLKDLEEKHPNAVTVMARIDSHIQEVS